MLRSFRQLILIAVVALLFAFPSHVMADNWPDLTGQTINVSGLWSGDEQKSFNLVLDRFTELTGARVVFNPVGENIATVLGTQIEGGNPPDVAILPQPGLLVDFAARGVLVPIEESAGDLVDQYYAPVWRELGSHDGTLYGIWYKAANKSLVWYNANLFEEFGVEPADTWDEFIEIAEIAYFYGIPPISLGGASSWTLTDWFENIYLRSAGPEMYDKLQNHEIPWTDPSVIEAFTYLKQAWGDPEWLAGGVRGSLEAGHPEGVTRPFLDPPQAAMAYGADFSASAIENETRAELGVDALFFDFPSINDSPIAVVGGGDVVVAFRDNEATIALMRFLAMPEAAEIWAAQGGFASPNQGVDPSVYPTEIAARSAEALQNAEWFRFDMSDLVPPAFGSTAGTGMREMFQEFVRNPDIEYVTEILEQDAQRAYGK